MVFLPFVFFYSKQVRDLELRLQKESARADQADRTNTELQDEHQAACDLAHSKDQLLELGQAEIGQLRESLAQATAQQEEHGARLDITSHLQCVAMYKPDKDQLD